MKEQERVTWENKRVKSHVICGKARWGCHKFERWGMNIMIKKEDMKIWEMRHEANLIKFAWKFGTQNLVATCTLNLMWNLEYFLKSILGKLYIFWSS